MLTVFISIPINCSKCVTWHYPTNSLHLSLSPLSVCLSVCLSVSLSLSLSLSLSRPGGSVMSVSDSNLLAELSFVTLTIHLCNGLNDKNLVRGKHVFLLFNCFMCNIVVNENMILDTLEVHLN